MSSAIPKLNSVRAMDPYALPTPIIMLGDLSNNFSAALINNLRTALYISNFIKRLMKSRVPCESMTRLKKIACSKGGFDTNNFIPLDTLVNVAERLSGDSSANKAMHTNINWGNDLTSTITDPRIMDGGYKTQLNKKTHKQIKQYAANLKKIFGMYVELFEPIHHIVQTGGHFYTNTLEILQELLKDFDYKKALGFMMYRPSINGKKLNRGLWHAVSDLHTGILKSDRSRLRALSNTIKNGKYPETRGMTIGLVEWKEWKKITEEGITQEQAKSEYTNIIKKGLVEVYDGYKNKNDKLTDQTEKIEENYEKLKENCNKYAEYEEPIGSWNNTQRKEQCESRRGCIWQLNNDEMVCHPGPNPGLLRSLMPEAITPSCGVSDGPCNLMKAITHFLCPYNKFNIELVEKVDKMFSQEKIIKFLKLFYKFAKSFTGKDSLISLSLLQVIRDMSVINLENEDNYQHLFESDMLQEDEYRAPVTTFGGGVSKCDNSKYSYIINPKTNRKVKLNSKLGNELIKKYFKYQNK